MAYEVLKVIGSGAHAIVHLARDSTTGELYAVKEFLGGGKAAHLFFRELSSLVALQHPNIVRCFDVIYGQGKQRNKLVLEYAAGGSLRDVLNERGKLTVQEAIQVLRDVAGGLDYAHRQQILHRDLKPENILVFPDSSTGAITYKVADLGIANHLANVFDQQQPNGSPAYMAPEQFYDFSTYASDLYSLGIIFYEILVGDRPFHGLPEELFAKHAKQPPDLRPIPELVRPIVSNLLCKSPRERLKSAHDLCQALDAQLTPPASAHSVTTPTAPPIITPATPHLEQAQRLEPWFTVELAGSQRLFVLNPAQRSSVYITDDRTTGFLELERRRFVPYFLPERITATATADLASPVSYFATNQSLYAMRADAATPQRLFQIRFPVKSLAITPSETLLILADQTQAAGYSLEGRELWKIELCNYLQPPQIVAVSDDDILVNSGPIRPTITCLDAQGSVKYQANLPSPALTVMRSQVGGDFHTILFGDGNQQPMRLVTFAGNQALAEMDLGEPIYAVNNHGQFATFFHSSGKISLVSDGLPIAEYQPIGMILDDAWVPAARAYLTIERQPPRTHIQGFHLTEITPSQL